MKLTIDNLRVVFPRNIYNIIVPFQKMFWQFKPLGGGKATRVKLIKYLKIFFRTINRAIFGVEHW